VAYVFIKMANSPRPGVWVLERSVDNGVTYQPWQYFADTPGYAIACACVHVCTYACAGVCVRECVSENRSPEHCMNWEDWVEILSSKSTFPLVSCFCKCTR
jgi:hypothetical protein